MRLVFCFSALHVKYENDIKSSEVWFSLMDTIHLFKVQWVTLVAS